MTFLPPTDGRAPAKYAPKALPSFSRPCWGIAAAESREAVCVVYRSASWGLPYQLLATMRAKSLQRPASNFPSLQNPASGFRRWRNSYLQRSQPRLFTSSPESRSGLVTNGSEGSLIRRRECSCDFFTPTKAGEFSNSSCVAASSPGGSKPFGRADVRQLTSKSGISSASIFKEAA